LGVPADGSAPADPPPCCPNSFTGLGSNPNRFLYQAWKYVMLGNEFHSYWPGPAAGFGDRTVKTPDLRS